MDVMTQQTEAKAMKRARPRVVLIEYPDGRIVQGVFPSLAYARRWLVGFPIPGARVVEYVRKTRPSKARRRR